MTFKLAIDAGHSLYTEGRRIPRNLDPEEHREWWLNDRVCRFIREAAARYEGFETVRVDDPTGEEDVPMSVRCARANQWGADLFLSIHHNAGINGGSGGGITAYSLQEGTEGASWRDCLYDAVVEETCLRGNRATPRATRNLFVLRETAMPAVLLECGFMDSAADVPVILTDRFAKSVAEAIGGAAASRAGLEKKPVATEPVGKSYQTLEDVPDWGKATVEKLTAIGALKGDGSGLNLSHDLLRTLVILDRLKVLEK